MGGWVGGVGGYPACTEADTPPPGGSGPRGVCSGGCLLLGGGLGVPGPEGVCSQGGWVSQHALRQTPLPPVDRQTLVKILPWPNFVAAGKYCAEAIKPQSPVH